MSKFVKLTDVKQILLEMSKEKTRSVGWGDVLMERLKDHSIEVSEDGEDYLRGYNDGWYAHEVITNAKLHIDKPRGFTLKTEKGYGNYSEDCISRAKALEIYSDLYWMDERLLNFKDELDKVYEKLRNAPSVVPTCQKNRQVERAEGEWITEEKDSIYGKKIRLTCSECGDVFDVTEEAFPYERYCRYCGAKMKG